MIAHNHQFPEKTDRSKVMLIHHSEVLQRIKTSYRVDEIRSLLAFLRARGAFNFLPLSTGLFPAAGFDNITLAASSGYGNVWIRDNIYVALAHVVGGDIDAAYRCVQALAGFYTRYYFRFINIIEGRTDPNVPMNRPQVRFDGNCLEEIDSRWSHAQNDALGYFLWFYCRMADAGYLVPDGQLLSLFVLYFEAIKYWEDEDNGHWEEQRKIEASSIGAVVAGLKALQKLLADGKVRCHFRQAEVGCGLVDQLIALGRKSLTSILPWECIQSDPRKNRRYDGALLFLIYPLDVVDDEKMEQQIVLDVLNNLKGDYGIRRYLKDSYWTADYKEKWNKGLTADVSECQDERDALVSESGVEAQWCIFDPIISIIAGRRYIKTHDIDDLERQIYHLNRSLGQITGPDCPQGEFRCPEAYYLENGRYVPNDHVPLLWTQANLWMALLAMEKSAVVKYGK